MPDVFISRDSKKKEDKVSTFETKEEVSKLDSGEKDEVKEKRQNKHSIGHKKGGISKLDSGEINKFVPNGIKYPKNHEERINLPGHTHNPLTAFCYFPDNVKFVNKDPEERVILLLRKHPITNIRWILLTILFLIIPVFLPLLSFFEILPSEYQTVLTIALYLMTIAYGFEKFLSWYFHVNLITDERIIEVDFHNLVYREITDANVDQIQDVTVEMGSPVRTALNFGDVIVQTAAQIPKIDFEAVPSPDKVAKVLRELRVEEEIEKLEGRVR